MCSFRRHCYRLHRGGESHQLKDKSSDPNSECRTRFADEHLSRVNRALFTLAACELPYFCDIRYHGRKHRYHGEIEGHLNGSQQKDQWIVERAIRRREQTDYSQAGEADLFERKYREHDEYDATLIPPSADKGCHNEAERGILLYEHKILILNHILYINVVYISPLYLSLYLLVDLPLPFASIYARVNMSRNSRIWCRDSLNIHLRRKYKC